MLKINMVMNGALLLIMLSLIALVSGCTLAAPPEETALTPVELAELASMMNDFRDFEEEKSVLEAGASPAEDIGENILQANIPAGTEGDALAATVVDPAVWDDNGTPDDITDDVKKIIRTTAENGNIRLELEARFRAPSLNAAWETKWDGYNQLRQVPQAEREVIINGERINPGCTCVYINGVKVNVIRKSLTWERIVSEGATSVLLVREERENTCFNRNGNIIRTDITYTNDGTHKVKMKSEVHFRISGGVCIKIRYETFEFDYLDNDGLTYTKITSYDGNGQLLGYRLFRSYLNARNIPERVSRHYTPDARLWLVVLETGNKLSGTVISSRQFYAADGQPVGEPRVVTINFTYSVDTTTITKTFADGKITVIMIEELGDNTYRITKNGKSYLVTYNSDRSVTVTIAGKTATIVPNADGSYTVVYAGSVTNEAL